VSPAQSTTYFVRDSNQITGCLDTAMIYVEVIPQPQVEGRDSSICEGSSVDLNSLLTGSILGTIMYGTVPGVYDQTNTLVSPTTTTTYYIRDSVEGTLCVDTTSLTMEVMNGMACLMNFTTANILRFGDPCNCFDVVLINS